MTITWHALGEITLNLSLFLYFVHFIPQIYHNIKTPHYGNISLNTQIIYFIATGLDMIYGLGFSYNWQYILADILYLGFLSVQQYQIMKAGYHHKAIHGALFTWAFAVIIIGLYLFQHHNLGVFIGRFDKDIFWAAGGASSFLWIVLWLPQFAKHIQQKQANGFARVFWIIAILMATCDIISALVFGWKWLNVATSGFLLLTHITLLSQSFYYSKKPLE